MTQIAATDNAIVRLLESCSFPGVQIFSGPREWDNGYLQTLLGATPAIVVAFLSGEPFENSTNSTELQLQGKWGIYICTGWNGKGQAERRLGAGAGLDLLHRAASVLHSAILMGERGERLPITQVEGIGVETDAAVDISNLWVGSIAVNVELPLDLLPTEDCFGPLDEFLRVRGPLVVSDESDDIDLAVDIPQS